MYISSGQDFEVTPKFYMNYEILQKGRGVLYAVGRRLYETSGKKGQILYLRCSHYECRGSGRIENGVFEELVRLLVIFMV